eukprot:TRINITY_DN55432_c0_g1_i2.p1 TRINITY_DN55432_c0_g1~~TRINITY_DN55432_c0_g1_i2.p1  ORF type:complete len:181 (-),score=20.58 TRINITY_DN55432_c0_g1_i2:23-502(-)
MSSGSKDIADLDMETVPEKLGAGILFCCAGEVLLLLRRSRHNDKTWGLPGGNADLTDSDLYATAIREATEELASVPQHKVSTSFLTKRGKRNQKHYMVYLCNIDKDTKDNFTPVLNEEHREWRWFEFEKLRERNDLHPVVEITVGDFSSQVLQHLNLTS